MELLELPPPEELEDELELPLLEEELLPEELDECPPDEEELLEELAPPDEEELAPLELPDPLDEDDDEAPLLPEEELLAGLPGELSPQALKASAMIALARIFPLFVLIISLFSYMCVNRMPAPELW